MELIKKGAVLSKSYWKHEALNFPDLDVTEGSLHENQRKTLTEQRAKKYFRDLILGLDYSIASFSINDILDRKSTRLNSSH